MNRIRFATQEEADSIAKFSDLDPTCVVLALDTAHGPTLAVVRQAIEVDPVIYPSECPDRMKAMFQRDIETFLYARGVNKYYFNIHTDNAPMLKVAETLGAEQTSTAPEFRFRKNLQ